MPLLPVWSVKSENAMDMTVYNDLTLNPDDYIQDTANNEKNLSILGPVVAKRSKANNGPNCPC